MLRTFNIILVGIMIAAAVLTYEIKHRSDDKLAEVRRLESEIKLEKETIHLLKADWALLSQPKRLERLTQRYADTLQLLPTEAEQLIHPWELPMLKSLPDTPQVANTDKPEPEGTGNMAIEPVWR